MGFHRRLWGLVRVVKVFPTSLKVVTVLVTAADAVLMEQSRSLTHKCRKAQGTLPILCIVNSCVMERNAAV